MLSILHALKRFGTEPLSTTRYALCRFDLCRKLARTISAGKGIQSIDERAGLFPELNVRNALSDLERSGLHTGFALPESLREEIEAFAQAAKCQAVVDEKNYSFYYKDYKTAETEAGGKILMAHFPNWKECDAVTRLASDPKLRHIAAVYLNGAPKRIDPRLWWSFAAEASVSERLKANQTVLFHYDLEGFQFVYFNFYINDVDEGTGPHVAVLGSHKGKALRHLFASANCSDEEVERTYGKENIVTITGPAGCSFIEDTFCYHKATAPITKDRLLLQIRMSL